MREEDFLAVIEYLLKLAISPTVEVGEVPVKHHARKHGRARYGLERILGLRHSRSDGNHEDTGDYSKK